MTSSIDRRKVLIAGAAAVAAAARPVAAQPTEISGTVTLRDTALIPEGQLVISLEDRAMRDSAQRRLASKRIDSDGRSKAIRFSLSPPAHPAASATLEIVVRLERADGWLLARGSAPFAAGSPIEVALDAVMY